MSAPRVTAVVVTYESARTIGAALASLRESHDAGLLECVVVDNASTDGTTDLVRARYPWVKVVDSGGNLGFGRGNNLGLEHVKTREVLFLNPDATLALDDLRLLLQFLDDNPAAGIVGPILHNTDSCIQELHPFPTPGIVIRSALGRLRSVERPFAQRPGTLPRRVDWLCGAALLARRYLLEELDGFDPRFFLYFEETDLCYRANRRGYETWVHGQATAHHVTHESARSSSAPMFHGCIAEHYFSSRYYYLLKHYGPLRATLAEFIDFSTVLARVVYRRLRGLATGDISARLQARCLRTPAPRSTPQVESPL